MEMVEDDIVRAKIGACEAYGSPNFVSKNVVSGPSLFSFHISV